MVRLFIALLLPDEIKQALEQLIIDFKPRGQGIRWVAAKNMHLTLKFVGETTEDMIEPIGQALTTVLDGKQSHVIKISGCGGFPNLKNPRVLWAGLDGAEPAAVMAKEIDEELRRLGFPKEKRPLSPHLTLGRIKQRSDISDLTTYMQSLTFTSEPITLDRVALVKSTLTPSGPIYENLKLFTLE
ncbi:MAG: RNA 2',3'-cyclic phosphodiesterase [FCB group bacterium]|nr:RNA 2',3'-cyclic phosphodiesterase [FCB group bacterium]